MSWDQKGRSLPRTVAGLGRYFKECGVRVSERYIREAIRTGGYRMESGSLTSANHFLKWKAQNPTFRCRFQRKASAAAKQPRPRPARPGALAGKCGE